MNPIPAPGRFRSSVAAAAIGATAAAVPAAAQDPNASPLDRIQLAQYEGIERLQVIGNRANRSRIPGAATYIGEDELETFQYQDIIRILRLAPGVNVQQEEGFGLRPNIGLRGTSVDRSEKITLMEDGVLIAPAPYAAPAAYYFPTAGRLEAVEVRKGSSSVKFGPRTVGGAINLVSRSVPERVGGFVDARVGELDWLTVHAAGGGTFDVDAGLIGTAGFVLETFQSENDGFKDLPDGTDVGGFDIEDYLAKFRIASSKEAGVYQTLQVKLGYTDNDSSASYLGLTDADFADDPFQRYAASARDVMKTEHWQVQVNHYAQISDSISLTTVAYYNDFARDWFKLDDLDFGDGRFRPTVLFDPLENFRDDLSDLRGAPVSLAEAAEERNFVLDVLRGDRDSPDDALQLRHNNRQYYSTGVQSIAAFAFDTFGAGHELEISVRYHEDEEDRLQWRENFRMDNGVMVPTSVDPVGSQANRVGEAKAWALFAQDYIEWGDFRFVPGVRAEIIDLERTDFSRQDPDRSEGPTGVRENEITAVVPGLGIFYDLTERLTLLGGVYRGFNPPGVSDAMAEEETSVNIEAGVLYQDGTANFEVIGFYSDVDDILGTCTNAVGCTEASIGDQFNGGAVDVFGLEVQGGVDLATGLGGIVVPLRANYTFTDADFTEEFTNSFWGTVEDGDELPYIPEHQLTVWGGLESPDWSLILLANYRSAIRTEAGQGTIPDLFRVDDRIIVDLTAHYQILDNLRLFFETKNLFDKEYAVARRPYGLRPGLEQTVMGGVTVSF